MIGNAIYLIDSDKVGHSKGADRDSRAFDNLGIEKFSQNISQNISHTTFYGPVDGGSSTYSSYIDVGSNIINCDSENIPTDKLSLY